MGEGEGERGDGVYKKEGRRRRKEEESKKETVREEEREEEKLEKGEKEKNGEGRKVRIKRQVFELHILKEGKKKLHLRKFLLVHVTVKRYGTYMYMYSVQ